MKNIQISRLTVDAKILTIRNHRVMLDEDLSALYEVPTRVLIQAVKRNRERFPEDFMFQLTDNEYKSLRSQIVILETGRGKHRKYLPHVFTQDGVAMLSSVLNSRRAIQINIHIIRAFNRLKGFLMSYSELREEIEQMKGKYDKQFAVVFNAIGQLLDGPKKKVKIRGFSQGTRNLSSR